MEKEIREKFEAWKADPNDPLGKDLDWFYSPSGLEALKKSTTYEAYKTEEELYDDENWYDINGLHGFAVDAEREDADLEVRRKLEIRANNKEKKRLYGDIGNIVSHSKDALVKLENEHAADLQYLPSYYFKLFIRQLRKKIDLNDLLAAHAAESLYKLAAPFCLNSLGDKVKRADGSIMTLEELVSLTENPVLALLSKMGTRDANCKGNQFYPGIALYNYGLVALTNCDYSASLIFAMEFITAYSLRKKGVLEANPWLLEKSTYINDFGESYSYQLFFDKADISDWPEWFSYRWEEFRKAKERETKRLEAEEKRRLGLNY